MTDRKNILFIMFDQLRWDYLSCYGHKTLQTPNLDRLAARGVRFDRAYIQSPICGASRMSTYTGRYVHSHGASWNNVPLKVGELTIGDHLRKLGMGTWLVGKTHMAADAEGMARLGLESDSVIGARLSECGFDVFERDDGLRGEGPDGFYDDRGALKYNEYLRDKGYEGDNPWHDFANSGVDDAGNVLSGWFLKYSSEPANIREDDSETPYLTRRGIEFMEQADQPWLCHLSYIKPHWPYVVPDPYARMFGAGDVQPLVRSQDEYDKAHPVLRGFMDSPVGRAFSEQHVRDAVIPAYMGLIRQCDDQMGVLFDYLERTGRDKNTVIVVTSDHGDYLGDHWMGEKTFFHDTAVRVPLIICDPSPEADATRGTVSDALVESIDLAPSFVEWAGGTVPDHILEGESLLPILHGQATGTRRRHVFAEYDYSATPLRNRLGVSTEDARLFMVADARWKLIHAEGGFRPILFDRLADPQELTDLGDSPEHAEIIDDLYLHLARWARRPAQRTTRSRAQLDQMLGQANRKGIVIGIYDPDDIPAELTPHYRNRKAAIHRA